MDKNNIINKCIFIINNNYNIKINDDVKSLSYIIIITTIVDYYFI